ncbi:MAG: FHA domain-containing protein [Bacteriovorax sp.]
MAIVVVIKHLEKLEVKEVVLNGKLVVGQSVYCDVKLDDKLIASMQCQFQTTKCGHVLVTNLDLKREVLINQARLKKSPLKSDDVLKIGSYVLSIDQSKLTPEELSVINAEYIEMV